MSLIVCSCGACSKATSDTFCYWAVYKHVALLENDKLLCVTQLSDSTLAKSLPSPCTRQECIHSLDLEEVEVNVQVDKSFGKAFIDKILPSYSQIRTADFLENIKKACEYILDIQHVWYLFSMFNHLLGHSLSRHLTAYMPLYRVSAFDRQFQVQ